MDVEVLVDVQKTYIFLECLVISTIPLSPFSAYGVKCSRPARGLCARVLYKEGHKLVRNSDCRTARLEVTRTVVGSLQAGPDLCLTS